MRSNARQPAAQQAPSRRPPPGSGWAGAWFPEAVTVALRARVDPWLLVVPAGLVLAGIVSWLIDWRLGVDSAVYRSGALALLHGEPLYDSMSLSAEPPWARLPFTYPPTAALLFVPLALFPTQVSWGSLGAAGVLGMALVIRLVVWALPERPSWLTVGRATTVLSLVLLGIEPVWRTLFLGQINLVLMALIVVDVLVMRGRRGGGLLLVLIPHDFRQFWAHAVTDPARTGPIYWAGNQSLNGLVLRLSDLAPWSLKVALAIGAVLAVPCAVLVRRLHLRDQPVPAMLVTAFLGLLVSPVSWSHHWVWAVPLIVYLLSRLPEPLPQGRALVAALVGVGAVGLVFVSCVLLIMRNGKALELDWTPWEFVIGSAYLWVPVVAGGFVLTRAGRLR